MTCRLDQRNPMDALYDRAKKYPGGIEALASRLGVSAKGLYNKFEHNNDTHHLRHDEFESTIALLAAANVPDAFAPLRALCWRFDHVGVHVPSLSTVPDSDLARDVVRVAAETGDVARRADEAIRDDGVIDSREWGEIDREIEEAVRALITMRDHGRAKFAAKVTPIRKKAGAD